MKVSVRKGQLVTDVLYQHLGDDNDQLDAAFYELNPHVRGAFFPTDQLITLPDPANVPEQRFVIRSWD